MNSFKRERWLSLLLLACFCLAVGGVQADDSQEEPTVKELAAELSKEYKNKKTRDIDRILEIYTTFDERYPDAPAADQKKIVKSLRQAFDIKPPIKNRDFLKASAACLGGMGMAGVDAIRKGLDSKLLRPQDRNDPSEVRECLEIRGFLIESMGFSKEPKAIKHIEDHLWDDEAVLVRAACLALGHYSDLPLKEKKDVVKELVKVYAYLEAQVSANPKLPHHREKLIAVEVAFNETLKKLTFRSFESAPDWNKWYNDNKGKRKW